MKESHTLVHPEDRLELLEFTPIKAFVQVVHYGWEKTTEYTITREKARAWYSSAIKRGWRKGSRDWHTIDTNRLEEHQSLQLELGI